MNKRKLVFALLAACALLPAGHVLAGFKLGGRDVTYDAQRRMVSGNLGTARNSSDTMQSIGCTVRATTDFVGVSCWATVKLGANSGLPLYCESSNPNIVAAAQAMTSDSYISFSWDDDEQCTSLTVQSDSSYEPKK